MAKRLLFDYVFTPEENKIVIPGNINQKRLLVITNTTDNIIIYNFADPTQTATFSFDDVKEETTVILAYDCSAMSSTDSLQIFEESEAVHFEPSETFIDPVSKFRVSNPENLIDTDFEYGPQASKWETLQLVNNIPSSFSSSSDTTIPNIVAVQSTENSDIITVTTLYEHNLIAGTPIDVKGLSNPGAEGNYLIQSVPSDTTFTYRCRSVIAATENLAGAYTSIIPGQFYSNSQINLDSNRGLLSDTRTFAGSVPFGEAGGFYIDGEAKPDIVTNKNGFYYFEFETGTYTSHTLKLSDHGQLDSHVSNEAPMGLFGKKIVGFATNGSKIVSLTEDGDIYDNDDLVVNELGQTANNWESSAISGSAKVKSVAYSPELRLYVGVGDQEYIAYSYDLRTWDTVARTPNTANNFRSVTWSKEKSLFVAVGTNGVVYTSATGTQNDWTSRNSGSTTDIYQKVIWSPQKELFVLVGSNAAGNVGIIKTSPDAITWTNRTSGAAVLLNSITWNANIGLFIVVGNNGTILSSPNATTWTARTSGTTNNLNDIASAGTGNLLLVVGVAQTAITSSDGISWALRTTGTSGTLNSVIWSDAAFKITDVNGKVITTVDGQVYTDITVAGHRLDRIVYSGDTYLVFSGDPGLAGTQAYFATKQNWATLTTIAASGGGVTTFRDLTFGNGTYIAVGGNSIGGNGVIFASTNGTSWVEQQTVAIPDDDFYKAVWSPNYNAWFFLGANGLYRTADLVTWETIILRESIIDTYTGGVTTDATRTAGTYTGLVGVTSGSGNGATFTVVIDELGETTVTKTNGGIGYAVSDTITISKDDFGGTGDDIVLTVDAVTSSSTSFKSVSVVTSTVIIVGNNGLIWTSSGLLEDWVVGKHSDGSQVTTNNLSAIAFDNVLKNRYVAVGSSGTIIYSNDSLIWKESEHIPNASTTTLNDVFYDGTRFIAVGVRTSGVQNFHTILASFDGMHWGSYLSPRSGSADVNDDSYLRIGTFESDEGVGNPTFTYLLLGTESGRIDLIKEGLVEYTEGVYYHNTVGSEKYYTRIYVTSATPDNLYYYCQQHGLSMGGNIYFDNVNTSNVYMKTVDENGFSQGTDFYIVNTISPKVIEVAQGSDIAPDGRPYVDTEETLDVDFVDNKLNTEVRDVEPSYVLKFDASNVNIANNIITFENDHLLRDGYALLYYTAPGDKAIGGLVSGQVYYANVTGPKSIKLTNCGFSTYTDKDKGDFPTEFHRWSQVNRLRASTTIGNQSGVNGNSYYGWNVSMSGDGQYCAVTAIYDDSYGSDRGAAYIYKRETNNSWTIQQRIGGGSGNSNSDYFGWSIDLNYDGSVLVVGIPYDDPNGTDSGRIQVWERNGETWSETATAIAPESNASQYFGNAVAINADGTIMAVGAYAKDESGTDSGSVWVYTYNPATNALALEQEVKPTDGSLSASDQYGISVDLDDSGTRLVVGSRYDDQGITDSGSAYFFTRAGAAPFTWTQVQRINSPSPSASAYFGYSVAISGDGLVLAVGAPYDDTYGSDWGAVYVYDWNAGTQSWDYSEIIGPELPNTEANTQGKTSLLFSYSDTHGRGISLDYDGSHIVVGCQRYDINGITREGTWSDVGATYVFERGTGSYVLEARILGSHSCDSSYFGNCVDIDNTGNYMISGAYYEYEHGPDSRIGGAYVFDGTETATAGATYNYGKHNLGLCWRIGYESHQYRGGNHYMYTAYWVYRQQVGGGTNSQISGYDLQQYGNNSMGLAGAGGPYGTTDNVDNTFFLTPYKTGPGYPRDYTHIGGMWAFGESYRQQSSYGRGMWFGNSDLLPYNDPIKRQGILGNNDFMVDDKTFTNYYNAIGGWGSGDSTVAPHYDNVFGGNNNPYVQGHNNDYINHNASYSYGWWYYSGGYFTGNHNYFSGWGDNWSGHYFLLPVRFLTEKNSFYSANHGLSTNDQVTYNLNSGDHFRYINSTAFPNAGPSVAIAEGSTLYIEKVDDNRFRVKTSPTSQSLRIVEANGDYRFTGTVTNFRKNSFYAEDHRLSTNNALLYNNEGIAGIGGLTDNTLYYANVLNGSRFQVRTAKGVNFNGNITANSNRISGLTINTSNLQVGQIVSIIANSNGFTLPTDTVIQTIVNATTIDLSNVFSGSGTVNGVSFNAGLPEIDITSSGSGLQAFEDQTTDFGVSDGGFKNTYIVDEKTLEIRIPFKIRPSRKLFDGSTAISPTNDSIFLPNHFLVSGTKVIYTTLGNPVIPGLVDNKDYFVIVLDDEYIQLAESYEDSLAGISVDITGISGYSQQHGIIHTNVAGSIVGTGSVSFEAGSRKVFGVDTNFKRYFKVGDKITFIDTNTTPGTFIEKEITAIKDDLELLVDTVFTQTDAAAKYLISTLVYVRPDGYYLHRPFDGGMEIGTSKSPDGLICRQTRKYFRYQSGKGIQTSFAINFNPLTPAVSAEFFNAPSSGDSTSGNYIRIRTKYAHNLNTDIKIIFEGANELEYNGQYDVTEIVNEFEFIVDAVTPRNSTQATGFFGYHIVEWSNSSIRAGMFDFQNGFFFEFDGKKLYAVRRSSTQQMTGTVHVTHNSNSVEGLGTKFTTQLTFGDKVVIRGQSYKVVKVVSDTIIKIQPSYRGTTTQNVIITKTVDTKVPQEEWNIDKCDGTGATGFKLDLTKIQMCYADYSWYGAGKIRFGFKDQNGHVKYIHEFKHNNRLTESYFRSGNLPARYEIENIGTPTFIPSLFHWGTSVIMDGLFQDDESYVFTASGNVQKFTNTTATAVTTNAASAIVYEFAGSGRYRFFIRLPFPVANATTLTTGTLIFNETTTGFLQDYFKEGRAIDRRSFISGTTYYAYVQYTDQTGADSYSFRPYFDLLNADKPGSSTVFYAGAPQGQSNQITTDIPLVSIRLAPSVDSSLTGLLGDREIINRMQLKLDSIGIQTTHETEITLVLNPSLSSDNFVTADSPSLSQLLKHEAGDTISGGQKIFTFRASGGSIDSSTGKRQAVTTNFDLSQISDLGNSILGGDDVFPNGPDVLTVVANIIDSTGVSGANPYTITGKISWAESQA